MTHEKSNKRAILGVILVLIGAFLVIDNFNFFPYAIRNIFFSWEMILIVLGAILLASRENKTTGVVLILIGGFFLIPDVLHIPYEFRRIFWPMIFIFIGLAILFRRGGHRSVHTSGNQDYIDELSVFGGSERLITSKDFKGGRVTYIFGGSTINLTQSELSKGENIIDVFTMFGGGKFIVPRDWDVKVEVTSVFGGFSDKRLPDPHIVYDPGKQLVIKGFVIFGGGELQSY